MPTDQLVTSQPRIGVPSVNGCTMNRIGVKLLQAYQPVPSRPCAQALHSSSSITAMSSGYTRSSRLTKNPPLARQDRSQWTKVRMKPLRTKKMSTAMNPGARTAATPPVGLGVMPSPIW